MQPSNQLQDRLSHLATWELFFEVLDCGSISQVADKHRLERSSLSRRIAQLEDDVGVPLLIRQGKNIWATQFALDLKERLMPVVVQFRRTIGSLKIIEDKPEGRIRLGAMPGFMQLQIVPNIIEFQKLYPRISFDVTTANVPEDYLMGQTDIMFYYGPVSFPHLVEDWVSTATFISCASPGYIAKHGTPESPEELINFAGIEFCGRQREHVEYLEYAGNRRRFNWKSVIRFNNILSVKSAVIEGGGIALDIPLHHCYKELIEGTLVPVFKTWHPPVLENYAAVTRTSSRLKRMQLFIDWYVKQRQEHDANQRREIHRRFGIMFNQ